MNDFFIADDLSGALDAGAAFHAAGRRVRVALEESGWRQAVPGEIIGFTTETRNSDPELAARRVKAAIASGLARGGRLLYKKIDSTLRGPVAAEVRALASALPGTRVLLAPANPRAGRTVREGALLVHGVPVAETDFARDPASPSLESNIRRLLGIGPDSRIAVPDTECDADLERSVAEMDSDGRPWVAIGSGALATAVARRMAPADRERNRGPAQVAAGIPDPGSPPPPLPDRMPSARSGAAGPEPQPPRVSGAPAPVLMLGGSAHPLNRTQAAALAASHGIPIHASSGADYGLAARAVVRSLRTTGAAILQSPEFRLDSNQALATLVGIAVRVLRETDASRIFITGGETAFAICEALGVTSLELQGEIEPGLTFSTGPSNRGRIALAIKPGGFGDARTWIRAFEHLRRN